MIVLTLYSRPGCHLCADMKATLDQAIHDLDVDARVEEINIANDAGLEARYGLDIPVLLMNGKKVAKYRVGGEELRRILRTRAGEAG